MFNFFRSILKLVAYLAAVIFTYVIFAFGAKEILMASGSILFHNIVFMIGGATELFILMSFAGKIDIDLIEENCHERARNKERSFANRGDRANKSNNQEQQ